VSRPGLEQRYRRVLRLLPGYYRDKWEEDIGTQVTITSAAVSPVSPLQPPPPEETGASHSGCWQVDRNVSSLVRAGSGD
jgi:hypothetical protein